MLLNTLLHVCRERGYIRERGKQRTDSTHVLAAIRTLNRLECVGETLRAALNSLAVVVPDWLRARSPVQWYERYDTSVDEFRLRHPTRASDKPELSQIGADGFQLLAACYAHDTPIWLRDIPAVARVTTSLGSAISVHAGEILLALR